MVWQVIFTDAYEGSLDRLENSEDTARVAKALLLQATNDPEGRPPLFSGRLIRVVKSTRHGGFPPLRLFYWIEGDIVFLAHIEEYAESEAEA